MMRFKVISLVAFLFLAFVMAAASSPQGFGRGGGKGAARGDGGGYDPAQTTTVRGEVVAIKDIESRNGKITGVGAEVQTDSETLLVYLGPHIYVDMQDVRIGKGDTVEVTGVRALLDGRQALLAGEVRKGDGVLKLRDDKGVPLWAGKRQSGGWN